MRLRSFQVCWMMVCMVFVFSGRLYGMGVVGDPPRDAVIQETISMGMDTITACISEKVVLSCSDQFAPEDILSYKWINKTTGDSIGNTRSIMVRPTNTTTYQLLIRYTLRNKELIVNGDFEKGEGDCYKVRDFGGMWSCPEIWKCRSFESDYSYIICNGDEVLFPEGVCKIVKDSRDHHRFFASIKDHSGSGYLLVANGSPDQRRNKVVWKQRITGMIPGKDYAFSAWVADVGGNNLPMLDFSINQNTLGGEFEYYKPKSYAKWEQFYKIWKADQTYAEISIVNKVKARDGNDFVLDDISFTEVVLGVGEVEVQVLPQVNIEALKNVSVCEDDDITVKANMISGSNITGYQWWRRKDGVSVGNTEILSIEDATVERDSGVYSCEVTGACGSDTVDFSIAVRKKLRNEGKEVDTALVCVRDRVMLSAARCSGDGLVYQWSKPSGAGNWTPTLGNTMEYVKQVVGRKDEGKYSCIVTGVCGVDTVYSVVHIREALRVVAKSEPQIACPGKEMDLFVQTNGKGVTTRWLLPDGSGKEGEILPIRVNVGIDQYRYEVVDRCESLPGFILVEGFRPMGALVVSEDTVVCRGGTAILRSNAVGVRLKYEWRGPAGFRGLTPNVVVPDVTENKEGRYFLTVTDTCGAIQRDSVWVSVNKELEGLSINPTKMYCLGAVGDTLQVKGGGSGLKYSWTLPDRTVRAKKKIVLPAIGYDNIGHYICRVSGLCGTDILTTDVNMYGQLTVSGNTELHRLCKGESIRLTAISNLPVLRYEWKKEGGVRNETGGELLVAHLDSLQAGHYECRVVALCDSKPLQYEVRLKESTKITDGTPDVYVNEHGSVRLFVKAVGENNVYEWTEKGMPMGGNSNQLLIQDVGLVGTRTFVCKVSGDCGEDRRSISVYVDRYKVLTKDGAERLCEGSDNAFNAALLPEGCDAATKLSYRWEWKGNRVSSTSVLELKELKVESGGRYSCYIKGECGEAVLNLDVEVVRKPVLRRFPTVVSVCEMGHFSIGAFPEGNDRLAYTWLKGNVPLEGTDSIFRMEAVERKDAGMYTCRVTGQCGVAEDGFRLEVARSLKILDAPDTVKACAGQSGWLEIVAVGEDLKYAWSGPNQSGWMGDTTFKYSNVSITRGKDEGRYRCVVESRRGCGIDTVYAVVEIEKELKLLSKSPDAVVCQGTKVDLYARVNLETAKYTWILPDGTSSRRKDVSIEEMKLTDVGVYHYRIAGMCMKDSGDISLGIHRTMGVLKMNPKVAVCCEHDTVLFVASVEGDGVRYRWQGPGHFLSANDSVVLSDVKTGMVGTYHLVVQDVCNKQQTGSSDLSLLDELKDLRITGDTHLCPGRAFVAEVKGGAEACLYEWMRGGVVVGREARFSIPAVASADSGEYVCRVVGSCGTKDLKVQLGIYKSLTFGEMVQDVRVCEGVDTSFRMVAEGDQLVYLWTKDGREVGRRGASLPFYGVSHLDTGFYKCRVKTVCGEEERVFHLQLIPSTLIKSHTPDRYVTENDSIQLLVRSEGENNSYQWSCEGTVRDEAAEVLKISDVGKADTLNFVCVVKGTCGLDSANMKIRVGVFKSLKETSSPDTLCEGGNYIYVADIIPHNCYGDEYFTYSWSYGGVTIGDQSLLKLENLKEEQAGEYTCLIGSECGVDTVVWKVYVMSLPEIQWMTEDAFVIEGKNHQIEVVAKGEGLSYSWKKDGVAFSGGGEIVSFHPVSYENGGIYEVTVENRCSSVKKQSKLKVWQKTILVVPLPTDVVMCEGTDSVFRVEALGSNGLLYQWYHNDVLLPVAMVDELSLKQVKAEDAGVYRCVVSGNGGDDTCVMNLTVNQLPRIEIAGDTVLCMNDLQQSYAGVKGEQNLAYRWSVSGGTLDRFNVKDVQVVWEGLGVGRLALEVTSAVSGCRRIVEKQVRYKQLPEVYLEVPQVVGYCVDSLVLNQGYPLGGQYWVDEIPASSVVFDYKESLYQVRYSYRDEQTKCVDTKEEEIRVAEEPMVTLKDERVETGLCKPIALSVDKVSAGVVKWTGEGELDTLDVLSPVYTPKMEDGEDVYFSVELTDPYQCRASDFEIISVFPLPKVKAMDDLNTGVCGETVLRAEYNTSRLDRITWLPADQLIEQGDYTAVVRDKSGGDHLFQVVVTDLFGCQGTDSVVLSVMPSPPLENKEFCENDSLQVDCSGFLDYVWNDGYIDSVRRLHQGGDYSLMITDKYGCVGTVYYTVHPMPEVNLRDTTLFLGQTVEFVINPAERYAPYDIVWQDRSNGDSFLAEKEGYYSVKVSDNLGCMSQGIAYVEMKERRIIAPDAFLPESSNENSRFYLKEVNFVDRFEMYIYDRWGELIFKTDKIGYEGGWNGDFKGIKCQPGAYVWVAFVNGKEIERGTLMLIK